MSTIDSPDGLFQAAARQFRDSLSPADSTEFMEFPSAKDMIQELNKRVSTYQRNSKLFKYCQRLERVSESLLPFFDIIGIFIQSKPEVPALVWGAMRMVFLLASNFSSFLDKLLAMFEKIGDRLPGYAEYYSRLLTRQVLGNTELDIPKFESTRVVKVLSYIYTDLVQFCQEACQVFGTKKRGVRYKAVAIADIFWKPFDVRFKGLLERIETHQALFLSEMQLEESKFTEYQFRKRERDSDNTNEAISQLKLQVSELKQSILEREETLTVRFERISEHIASMASDRETSRHRSDSILQVSPIFDTTFRQIAKWINASDFSRELNKAQALRLDNTGDWFLASPCYRAFKSLETEPMESGSEPQKLQMMFIQAKPGYGKTILSSLLIEDLTKAPEIDSLEAQQAPATLPVLYYHFASGRAEECSPAHGLRACLHQIIHYHTKAADVLDAVSIIAETDGTGQMRATDEDVIQCLLLLLTHQTSVTLIFDGLDECNDPPDLFRTVYELCCRTGAKAIFLGRPNFEPPRGCNSYTVISLQPWQNVKDIQVYLQPEIEYLKSGGLLPESSNIQEIVILLSYCAQGMFLWARLVVRYLSNTWLSPRERVDAIFEDTMSDGLGNLYGKIIAILERSHPAQLEKVHRIFQTMAISRRSFTLYELRQIIAVRPGRVTREEDFIVDFENCLPVMSGALVECDSSGHVRFIHSSFRDYIVESKYCQDSPLAVTKQNSWLTLTTICLSYLTYDIPRGPISAAGFSDNQRAMITECFPLLGYGVDRLQQRDQDIFDSAIHTTKDEIDKASNILQALEGWIMQRCSVTAWIEANFSFQQLPTLEPLISMMKIWCLRYEVHRERAATILSLCLQFEKDLAGLRNDWAEVLFREPCAIWTSTITAFAESSFWVAQNDTKITRLGQQLPSSLEFDGIGNDTPSMIILKSQTAADKMTHATIHVIPSRSFSLLKIIYQLAHANMRFSSQYINFTRNVASSEHKGLLPFLSIGQQNHQYLCANWKAQYQIRDINSQIILFSIILDLPTDDVWEVLKIPIEDNHEGTSHPWLRFGFPVTISADLHRVLMLRTLLILRTGTATGVEKQSGTYALFSQHLKSQSASNKFYFQHHYGSMFSPMGDTVAFFENNSPSISSPQALEVWSKGSYLLGPANEYYFRGRSNTQTPRGMPFLFHPSQPLLVFTNEVGAYIWYFHATGRTLIDLFIRGTIELVAFEDDAYLCYRRWILSTDDPWPNSMRQVRDPFHLIPSTSIDRAKLREPSDPLRALLITVSQSHTMTTTKKSKDSLRINRLIHTRQDVIIRSANGQTAQFGHIPPLQSWEPSSVTLLPVAGSVKVIWDKELQNNYSVLDTPSSHLPCLIERTLHAVPLLEQASPEDPVRRTNTGVEGQFMTSQSNKRRSQTEDDSAAKKPSKRVNMSDAREHGH